MWDKTYIVASPGSSCAISDADSEVLMLMESPGKRYRILVIDDDGRNHQVFSHAMALPRRDDKLRELEAQLFGAPQQGEHSANASGSDCEYEFEFAFQGQQGHELVRRAIDENGRSPYAAIFVDMRMPPGWDGMLTMEELWRLDQRLQLVMCSAYTDYSPEEIQSRLGSNERFYTLKKPFQISDLRAIVRLLATKWELEREVPAAAAVAH